MSKVSEPLMLMTGERTTGFDYFSRRFGIRKSSGLIDLRSHCQDGIVFDYCLRRAPLHKQCQCHSATIALHKDGACAHTIPCFSHVMTHFIAESNVMDLTGLLPLA